MKNKMLHTYRLLVLVCLMGVLGKANATNYITTAAGSFFSASVWSGGSYPINSDGSNNTGWTSPVVYVNNPTILDGSGGTTMSIDHSSTYYFNSNLTDVSANGWNISTANDGGSNITFSSDFYVQGTLSLGNNQTTTFSANGYFGTITQNNTSGTLIIKSGYSVTVTSLNIADKVTIEPGATLIVLGNVNVSSNSQQVTVDGNLIIYGNLVNNGQPFNGNGYMTVGGTVTNSGSGSATEFGSNQTCTNCTLSNSANNPTCPGMSASIAAAQTICTGSAPTAFTSTVTGSVTYQWQYYNSGSYASVSGGSGATTASYTSGTLSATRVFRLKVTSTSGSCFIYSPTITVSVSTAAPTNTSGKIYGVNPICLNTSGTFSYSITGITNATSYSWTVPSGFSILSTNSNVATLSVTGLQGGTISVSGINNCGRSSVTTFAVTTINSAPGSFTVTSITGSSAICQGTQQVYSISGVSNVYTYNWTLPSGFSIYNSSGTGYGTIGNIIYVDTDGSSSGSLMVSANNACGSNAPVTKSITVNPLPDAAGSIVGNTVICSGVTSSYAYSVAGISNATLGYGWTISGTNSSKNGFNTAYTAVNTLTGTATANLYVKNTLSTNATIVMSVAGWSSCGIGSASIITITATGTAPTGTGTITGTSPICQGNTGVYTISGYTGVGAYTWTVPSGFSITSTNGTSSPIINVSVSGATSTGSYTLSVSGSGCGISSKVAKVVTVTSAVSGTAVISGTSGSVCANTTNTFTVSGISNTTGYLWSVPAGFSITSGSTSNIVTVSVSGTASTGTLTVMGYNNCSNSNIATYNLTVGSTVGGSGTISGVNSICQNATGIIYSLTSTYTNATTYTWTMPTGFTITSGNGTATVSVNQSGTSSGTISVTGANSCYSGAVATLAVTVNAVPSGSGTISGTSTLCSGSSAIYTVSGISNASTYTWSVPTTSYNVVSTTLGTATISVSGSALSGILSVSGSNSCGSSSTSTKNVTVSGTVSGTLSITNNSGTICINQSGLVYTASGLSGATTYNWTVPSGFSVSSGQGTSIVTLTTSGTAASAPISVTGANTCGTSSVATYTVSYGNSWLGVTTNWSTASNWCGGVVPGSSTDITIVTSAGITNMPVLSSNASVRNVTIGFGASLSLSGSSMLTVAGSWYNSGTFVANSSTVVLNGATSQTVTGTNSFYNLNVNNSITGATFFGSPSIVNTLTLGNGAIINTAGATFKIISTSTTGTGRIAAIPTNAVITGNITMQRFVPAKKANRFFSSAISNGNLSQLRAYTWITGNGTGFDASTYNIPVFQWYNETLTGPLNTGWSTPSNINFSLTPGMGYQLFVRGSTTVGVNTSTGPTQSTVATTLEMTGTINKGTVSLPVSYTSTSYGVTADGWNLVGNPYPCEIDWNLLTRTNVDNAVYIWDPGTSNTSITSNTGAYVTYKNGVATPSRTNPNVIASSQGFFVRATATGASLVVNESAKVSLSHTAYFRQETPMNLLRVKVSKADLSDEAVIRFHSNATLGYDAEFDAEKLPNTNLNITSYTNQNTSLSINAVPVPDTAGVEIPVSVKSTAKGTYKISFDGLDAFEFSAQFYLKDKFLNTSVPITSATIYSFDITTNTGSNSDSRFAITAKNNSASVKQTVVPASDSVSTTPKVEESVLVDNTTVNGGTVVQTSSVSQSASGDSSAVDVVIQPEIQQSTTVDSSDTDSKVMGVAGEENDNTAVNVYPNPFNHNVLYIDLPETFSSNVLVEMYNAEGDLIWTKHLIADMGKKVHVQLEDTHIPAGVYTLKITETNFIRHIRVVKI